MKKLHSIEKGYKIYTFTALSDIALSFGTSKFIGLNIYAEESARFRGALLTLKAGVGYYNEELGKVK